MKPSKKDTGLCFIGIVDELSIIDSVHKLICFEFAFLMQNGVHYQDSYVAFLHTDKKNSNPIFLN